ncbi:22757_t:CDS:2, partial [Cetraspora pellucida]
DVPRRVPVLATPPLPAFEGRLFPSASLGLPYSVREPSTSGLTRDSNLILSQVSTFFESLDFLC